MRVGTVDKFQGQEAPVVFYSTASSSGEEIPRGLEFLFSRNRLNVAISRAQCLAYLVGSPRLLDVRCRSVEQMRLVNALCRFVEVAESPPPKLRIVNRASSLISHLYHAGGPTPMFATPGGVAGGARPPPARGAREDRRGARSSPPPSPLFDPHRTRRPPPALPPSRGRVPPTRRRPPHEHPSHEPPAAAVRLSRRAFVRALPRVGDDATASEWVEAALGGGVRVTVPDLVYGEVANALLGYVRARQLAAVDADEAMQLILEVPVRVVSLRSLAVDALALAREIGLSAYDNVRPPHRSDGCNLVTADRRLAAAVERVALIPNDGPPSTRA